MTRLRFLSAAAILALTSGIAIAQTPAAPAVTAPAAKPAAPAVVQTAPAPAVAKPAVSTATTNAVKKLDLNTATADELGKLPQIGDARSKAIVEARLKGKFKDWADFDKRDVIPSNAEAAIKDLVIVR